MLIILRKKEKKRYKKEVVARKAKCKAKKAQ